MAAHAGGGAGELEAGEGLGAVADRLDERGA